MKAILALSTVALLTASAAATACSVSGTALNDRGQPLSGAIVRLVDIDTRAQTFALTDAKAGFVVDGNAMSGQRLRLDLISAPTAVTGTRIRTSSIVGQSEAFACQSGSAHQDVQEAAF